MKIIILIKHCFNSRKVGRKNISYIRNLNTSWSKRAAGIQFRCIRRIPLPRKLRWSSCAVKQFLRDIIRKLRNNASRGGRSVFAGSDYSFPVFHLLNRFHNSILIDVHAAPYFSFSSFFFRIFNRGLTYDYNFVFFFFTVTDRDSRPEHLVLDAGGKLKGKRPDWLATAYVGFGTEAGASGLSAMEKRVEGRLGLR